MGDKPEDTEIPLVVVDKGDASLMPTDDDLSETLEFRHVRLYVDTDDNYSDASSYKEYPDDSHIHDEHELAKPRINPETKCHAAQLYVKVVVEHIAFRLLTIGLILTEFVIVTVDLAINSDGHIPHLNLVSIIIMGYFLLELALRIFYKGELFFHSWLDILDLVIVTLTFIIDLALSDYARLGIIGRGLRILRIIRGIYLMCQQRKQLASATRRIVSQNKRRYVKDGFELDLCYITEHVIAMSFPSSGIHTMYRNNIREVSSFFNTKHKDHYKVYNLCSEREYNEEFFEKRVERICIDDHNVPTLKQMVDFCENVHDFLAQHPDNVVAIHCKGGKGRTGTMICTWLVECGIFEEAKDSLDYFGDRRTDLDVGKTFQGVETPSQSRFVEYFGIVRRDLDGLLPKKRKLRIKSIKINAIKGVGNGNGSDLSMQLWHERQCIFVANLKKEENCKMSHDKDDDSIEIKLENCPVLVDDIKVRFTSKATNIPKVYDKCAFYFWFHTAFVEDSLLLTRDEIDNPHKKRAQRVFREDFSIEVFFGYLGGRRPKALGNS